MNRANQYLEHLREVLQGKTDFPIGTLVYFGPDDRTITKIVAVIIRTPEAEPIIKSWEGPSIAADREAVLEIGSYFKDHQVGEVVMTEGVVGCPHEEGVDYPVGESCPYCPFWD
jgi:hypothetical protein